MLFQSAKKNTRRLFLVKVLQIDNPKEDLRALREIVCGLKSGYRSHNLIRRGLYTNGNSPSGERNISVPIPHLDEEDSISTQVALLVAT